MFWLRNKNIFNTHYTKELVSTKDIRMTWKKPKEFKPMDANNYQQEKNTCFHKIIHLSIQFSAIVNRFIVKTKLTSAFTNDLKRKENFSKNVHSCRLSQTHPSFYSCPSYLQE